MEYDYRFMSGHEILADASKSHIISADRVGEGLCSERFSLTVCVPSALLVHDEALNLG